MPQTSTRPLLMDLAQYFLDKGFATALGTDLFRDFTPEKPDNVLVMHEYKGSTVLPNFFGFVTRKVQILVRDTNAAEAQERILEIFSTMYNECEEDGRLDLTDTRFIQTVFSEPPYKIKYDESDRTYFVFNIKVNTSIY